jgi:hypothetical protein
MRKFLTCLSDPGCQDPEAPAVAQFGCRFELASLRRKGRSTRMKFILSLRPRESVKTLQLTVGGIEEPSNSELERER